MGVENKKTRTKTRRHLRDLDQVKSDMLDPKHLAQYKATKDVFDLPGLGEYYCVECAKWFENDNSIVTHLKGKTHKRRVKALKAEAYTQEEAERCAGIGRDNGPPRPEYTPAENPFAAAKALRDAAAAAVTQDAEVEMET